MSSTPCDLHEVTNCAFCTGAAKRHEATLVDDELDILEPLPWIPGGVSIHARFPGTCDGCGERYPKNTPIFRPSDDTCGWVRIECCLDKAR